MGLFAWSGFITCYSVLISGDSVRMGFFMSVSVLVYGEYFFQKWLSSTHYHTTKQTTNNHINS